MSSHADISTKTITADTAECSVADGSQARQGTDTERLFSEILAEIVGAEQVSVDGHFFDDLGADSMVMARFCARVRKRADLPSVSMKEIYRHPTISSLTKAVTDAPAPAPVPEPAPAQTETVTPAGTSQYVLCGALQFLLVVGLSFLPAFIFDQAYDHVTVGSGLTDIYVRSVTVGGMAFLGLCIVPIVAKWLLIGRWRPQKIRIWSLAYVRFWIVKVLIRSSPLVLFVGSPIYVLYLRALGARIGRGAVILSQHMPVCTDLLTIGDNTIIRKDSFFTCYRAQSGQIQTGPVSLGRDALVGEWTALDIGTSLGNGAQLGHSSSLDAGQSVPDGEHWHGSPAQHQTEVDYRTVGPTNCGTLRKSIYSIAQLLYLLLLPAPLAIGIATFLVAYIPRLAPPDDPSFLLSTGWSIYGIALVASCVLFFGFMFIGLVFVGTVPRVLSLIIKPDKVYPLYGLHFWVHRFISRVTNVRFFNYLFGDSSYVVHYLRWLGYDLSRVKQTGSNFGLDVRHETPYLVFVGRGTMVADGLSIINADYSTTSFRVSQATIGADNFIGNYVAYPSQGRTGDNCLLATKAMIPVQGKIREDVGLLGSPSFEIPRSVLRDGRFDHLRSGDEFRRRLAAKNKHNAVTMGLYLLASLGHFFGIVLLVLGAADLYHRVGLSAIVLASLLALLFSVVYDVLVERAGTGFQALQPQYCSIYEPEFWPIERYWKLALQPFFLDGTAFKGLIWWLLGVRIGKRVFDDGCLIMEKTLVTIGDDCALNAGSIIQPHSQEDATFKSDRITIGARCSLGTNTLVHYGVKMGDGAQLAAGAFLMKGEEVPPNARWGENPARESRGDRFAEATKTTTAPRRPAASSTAATVSGVQTP